MFHIRETETLKLSMYHILFGISERNICALLIENMDSHVKFLL
jgi:hypothetical protein